MAKVTVNGEVFAYDGRQRLLSEAIEIEDAYGKPFGQWEMDLASGSARALALFVWDVWRRNGRDVPVENILDGTVEIDSRVLVEADAEPGGDGR
jgi:hypothetical protein